MAAMKRRAPMLSKGPAVALSVLVCVMSNGAAQEPAPDLEAAAWRVTLQDLLQNGVDPNGESYLRLQQAVAEIERSTTRLKEAREKRAQLLKQAEQLERDAAQCAAETDKLREALAPDRQEIDKERDQLEKDFKQWNACCARTYSLGEEAAYAAAKTEKERLERGMASLEEKERIFDARPEVARRAELKTRRATALRDRERVVEEDAKIRNGAQEDLARSQRASEEARSIVASLPARLKSVVPSDVQGNTWSKARGIAGAGNGSGPGDMIDGKSPIPVASGSGDSVPAPAAGDIPSIVAASVAREAGLASEIANLKRTLQDRQTSATEMPGLLKKIAEREGQLGWQRYLQSLPSTQRRPPDGEKKAVKHESYALPPPRPKG